MTSSPSLPPNGRQLGGSELVISHCSLCPVKLSTEFCMWTSTYEVKNYKENIVVEKEELAMKKERDKKEIMRNPKNKQSTVCNLIVKGIEVNNLKVDEQQDAIKIKIKKT